MTNNYKSIVSSNYPIDTHIAIHYQKVDLNTENINDSDDDDSISPLNSSPSTPLLSPISSSSNSHMVQTVFNLPNQFNNYKHDHITTNLSPTDTNNPSITKNFHQSRNIHDPIYLNSVLMGNTNDIATHIPLVKPLARRFTEPEPLHIDTNVSSFNTNVHQQISSPQIPCSRHHHRRNTIAIKFNKPLYNDCLTNK